MSTELSKVTKPQRAVALSTNAKKYARKSRSPKTIRTYSAAWREFEHFAAQYGVKPLDAETELADNIELVCDYLSALADNGAAVSTIQVKLAAIAWAHRTNAAGDPTVAEAVKAVMAGIRRENGTAPNKKEPAQLDEVSAMIATLPKTAKGKRDKALLLLGYAGAFRRSELVALDVADLRFNRDALKVTVKRSKTDQEKRGMVKTIPQLSDADLCPVRALHAWLDVADIASGPVFRRMDRHGNVYDDRLTDQSVALVVKAAAKAAGLDWRAFSGHSLRSGFVTQSMDVGASDSDIMDQTGHKSVTVMRGYRKSTGVGAKRAVKAAFGKKPRKTLSQKAQE